MSNAGEIDADDAKLAAAGFDATLAPAQAIAKLRELRAAGAAPDIAIARALGNVLAPEAAAMLAEMEAGAAGALRREIRRSLFRLKQHNIEPRADATPSHTAAPLAETSALTAMLSPIDVEGARIVWILKPRVQSGVTRLWALISDADGLVGAQNSALSRRELKLERAELEKRAGVKLVEADWRLADFIACEAYRNTPAARRAQVGNFLTLRAELIGSPPPTQFEHPVYAELSAEIGAEPSVELLKAPELLEWRFPAELIKPYVEKIGRAGESVIVTSPIHQQERVNAVIERAVAELLSGESGMKIRRRLEDIAYYMLRDGRRTQAGWAAAAAKRLRDGVDADAKRSLFFQALIRTQLGTVVAAEQQKAAEEPRLIMTPAEAMRAREARESRMRRR
ncbi:MAG TPA: hypothetical protein VEU51_07225 [Candidatus Acidoferrales bacterium]|nr:hypothetical protein [Candidatus Acidoferrales bacterium]